MPKILVIEDEAPLLEEVLDALRFENFDAIGAAVPPAGQYRHPGNQKGRSGTILRNYQSYTFGD